MAPHSHLDDTTEKATLHAIIEFRDHFKLDISNNDIFKYRNISKTTGYRLLRSTTPPRGPDDPEPPENRGRPSKVTPEHVLHAEAILQEHGFGGETLTWAQLASELGIDCTGQTLRTAMGSMEYSKCPTCRKGWVSPTIAEQRKTYAEIMLLKHPRPVDWTNIWFSGEIHFGWGPTATARINRDPGMRFCVPCDEAREREEPEGKGNKRPNVLHAWVAVGYNFKSQLVFYDAGNTSGKMTMDCYISQMLDPIVKSWKEQGYQFDLEEDPESGHGIPNSDRGRKNKVELWKQKHNLTSHFSCSSSPDLSVVEDCWQPPKQYLKGMPQWDEEKTRQLILEGWERVTQDTINQMVLSMPQRLQAVVNARGFATGY